MNKHEVSESKYFELAQKVVELHESNGVKILGHYDEYGINQYHPSEKGIEFSFYWDALDTVNTEDGSLSFGSKSGFGHAFPKAKEALENYFGLELLRERDGMRGERWFIYKATKNVPQ